MFRLTLILSTSVLLLSACAVWPVQGRGGQAEDYEYKTTYLTNLRLINIERLDCFHREIQYLSSGPASKIYPAKFDVLSKTWNRARRAHAGHLTLEASIDLNDVSSKYIELISLINAEIPDPKNNQIVPIKTSYPVEHSTAVEGACS